MTALRILAHKRDGGVLSTPDIHAFVRGLCDASWSDAQVAALAMAICIQGLNPEETRALTWAMARSGDTLDWRHANLPGPVLDKHSTGGVGDKVSLMLAPLVAACGGYVPMVSGRGLGHTGGTLDKLESIPGYCVHPTRTVLADTLRLAGCAIVGADASIAPADARLYAIRDATGTVDSLGLITASILSKKLAAGLQGLVLDIKVGNGAFANRPDQAQALAQSLVQQAHAAGLPVRAWLTDMNEVLGQSCGNALEMGEAVRCLKGLDQEPRLWEVTRTLAADLLVLGGIASTLAEACQRIDHARRSGAALERLGRMVHALGGPADFCDRPHAYLARAPAVVPVVAPQSGWVSAMATRDIAGLVVQLGGGRTHANARVDHRVGLSACTAIGHRVEAGQVLARVHAADDAAAHHAAHQLLGCIQLSDTPPPARPVVIECLQPPATALL